MRKIYGFAGVVLFAAIVASGCGKFGEVYQGESSKGSKKSKDVISSKPFDAAAAKAGGCGKIETFKEVGSGSHVEGDIKYKNNPPTSGKHNPAPVDWGIYDKPQKNEKLVHNQEHGHIVVTYKGISDSDRDLLVSYVKRDPFHLVVVPRPKNPKDGVYFTSWKARLYCKKPSAPALQEFVDLYRDKGPELTTNDPMKPEDS